MLALTLWSVTHLTAALPTLNLVRPGAIQIHSDPQTLANHGVSIAKTVRAEVPGAELWVGIAGDVGHDAALPLDKLHNLRMAGVRAAQSMGATRVVWNAEAAWKTNTPGFTPDDAIEFVAATKGVLGAVPIYVTSFDCPGFHAAFPYRAFDTGDGWMPQIYAAPARGVADLAAAKQRLALHQKHWQIAIHNSVLRPRPVCAYVQAHHVTCEGTCAIANAYDETCFWAIPDRGDEQGLLAAQFLAELERRGYHGPGRIERFQADSGLNPDAVAGPKTRAALGL